MKNEKLKKIKFIRFRVTEDDFKKYQSRKNSLLRYSPTLSASNILRSVSNNLDDKALIMFLMLDNTSDIRTGLILDFEMMFKINKKL